jgi:lipoprotein-releasing system ATP-binding protein
MLNNLRNIILRAECIKKNFNIGKSLTLNVLKGIDLEIRNGEIDLIVGASGAGKSTLLHILGGLDKPTEGYIYYGVQRISDFSDENLAKFRNREVGFVFQFHHLLPEFTALENVCLPAMILGKNIKSVMQNALTILNDVGLSDRVNHKPNELSGGEQQRVAVARSLINSPKIIFADEPSGNLDTENSQSLHKLIFDLRRKYGQTFVIVTHNQELIEKADHIYRIIDGKIVNNA